MKWIAQLPSTNFRIFVSVLLAIVYVLAVLVGVVLNRINGDSGTLYMIGGFLLVMMGLDVAQFKVKRETAAEYQATSLLATGTHQAPKPDVEDTQALLSSRATSPVDKDDDQLEAS